MTTDRDYDDVPRDEVVVDEDEVPVRRSGGGPLRFILLAVLLLVVICCGGILLLRAAGNNLVANLPIPLLGREPEITVPSDTEVIVETPTLSEVATEEVAPPQEELTPATAEESPAAGEMETPAGDEGVVEEPAEGVTEEGVTEEGAMEEATPELLAQEPTEEPAEAETGQPLDAETGQMDEHAEDMEQVTVEATVEVTPVPGPTATATLVLQPSATSEPGETPETGVTPEPGATPGGSPTPQTGPTVVVTVDNCQANDPPTADADGPYQAMMGKGQAFVTFDGSGSSDSDGTITKYEWDFGDNSAPGAGQSVTHGYASTGTYTATLTITDNCNATDQSTATVTIVGPTPPATATEQSATPSSSSSNMNLATPGATVQPASVPVPASATQGFCYRVQYGDTLTNIGRNHGVAAQELAEVNHLNADYLIAGQGLFIPSGEINAGGNNVYLIQPGDTLASIASQCGLTVTALAAANGMMEQGKLAPGQFIVIPSWR
jgi:LysM repeat protein